MGIIFAAVLLFFVAISVLWSVFVRKLVKTRIKSICKIVCLVLAIIGTVAIKDFVLDQAFIKDTLLPSLSSSLPAEAMDLINASPVLLEVAAGLPVALVTPIIFVILYIVFAVLASIVYMFILLFAGRKLKNSDKNDIPYAKARSIAWSACSAILALVVILLPIAFYGGLADDAMSVLAETDVMDAETQKMVDDITKEYVDPITKGTVVEMFRAFGGDMIIDEMTSFPLGGETVYVKNEFGAIANLAGDVMPLVTAEGGPGSFGDKEADALVAAVNSLTKSKFLTAIASEVVYIFTDDMVNGEEPMVMADNEMFGDLISRTITIVHDDAKNIELFKADLKTVADMASALIKGGVLANMDDTDALMDELAGGDTIKNVIVVLGKNNSMKCLIPSVTNIGIEAIASAVEVKADANEAYNDLLNTIAAELNSFKNLDTEEAQNDFDLPSKLNSAFDHAGIVIDKKDIDSYSAAMIENIVNEKDNADITADDVQNFFVTNTTTIDTSFVQSVEAFEEATLLVFLDELVIDVDEAAKSINNDNVNQEAEAIGGIFSQAGTLMDDVSGEINISTMAESVGGILNSLNKSVCVGEDRTSKLFIAIVQSGMVRDAANMDIATATELGTKGSTGENIDYAKTFKTISNTMDILQNMNSSTEGGMETPDLTVVLKDLNPQTAGMIETYITEDRLSEDYGLNAEQSGTAAPLISDVFGYMGDPKNTENMTDAEYEAEAQAITDVMNLVTSASDKANSGDAEQTQTVFGEPETSIIGKDAKGTVETFMASESIKHSLNNNSDKLEEDPFGMGDMMVQDGEKDEKLELEIAMKEYYEQPENKTEENKKTLTNLGKLFGFSQDEMHFILGE